MSREYKFRAWSKERKAFIVGFNMVNFHSYYNKGMEPEIYRYSTTWKLSEIELLQYTGLKDKNGVDIYEGDIGEILTQTGRIERFVVKWGIHRREMASGWTVDIPGVCFEINGFPSFPIANNYNNGHDLDIITIIGNIYENPDLLQPPTTETTTP